MSHNRIIFIEETNYVKKLDVAYSKMCRFLTRSSLGLSAKQPILHLPHPLLASTYLCKNNTIIGRQNKVTTVANITTWALKINALITGCLEMKE